MPDTPVPTASRSLLRSSPHFAVLATVLALGVVFAGWLYSLQRERKEAAQRAEIERTARAGVELLRSRILRSLEILHSVTALFEARGPRGVTRGEFRSFVQPALARQPELLALEWIPRVAAAERTRFEQLAASDGLDGFRFTEIVSDELRDAGPRAEYFPVFYVEPVRGNAPALGLDLASDARRRTALDRAAQQGRPTATEPIRLAQETAARPGFLVFAPVRGSDGTLAGFGLAVFRIESLVRPSLAAIVESGLRVEIRDAAEPASLLFEDGAPVSADAAPLHEEDLALAGRTWRVRFLPGRAFVTPGSGVDAWIGPGGVCLATLLLAAYLVSGMRRTAEIERKVREKTAELSQEVVVRQRAEEAMRVAERKYRSIFENAIDGIFQSSLDGRYLSANPALAHIYGYATPEELLASLSDIGRQLYVERGRREEFVRRVREQGAVADFTSRVFRRDGSTIWISEKALAVRDDAGALLYFEGIVEDVTERVAAAEAQRRANEILEERVAERTAQLATANRAKSLFLANMSHEIRTPLNAILGYTQLLQRDAALAQTHGEAVGAIVEGGNHLLCLIDGVLDLSKIEAGHMEITPVDFDLTVLVKGLAAIFQQRCQQKGLRLNLENLGSLPVWVHGDERKLRQVLVNLLSNAVKFTDDGEIRLRVVPEQDAGMFRFEVIDTGPGIAPEAQARIFEPFQQDAHGREKGGTGLGLSIARRLLEIMGSRLEVKSTARWGTNFFFILAVAPARTVIPSLATETNPAMRLAPGTRVRALVVDDLRINRDILGQMLRAIGCEVAAAENGESALAQVAQHHPDIVFMDIRMPGLNGIDTARALLTANGARRPRVVSYSASAFEHERAEYERAGFDGFLPKPFRFERLHECLRKLLGVEFVPADAPPTRSAETSDDHPLDLTQLALSPEALSALRAATEIGDFAALREVLDRIEPLGAEPAAFARRLRHFASRFNTEVILAMLAELPVPDAELPAP